MSVLVNSIISLTHLHNKLRSRRSRLLVLCSSLGVFYYLLRKYRRYLILKRRRYISPPTTSNKEQTKIIPSINKRFLEQLRVLLKILFPKFATESSFLLLLHTITLLSRTFLSIFIARLDGAIVKSLVQRNANDFIRTLAIFLAVAIPASFINSLIRFAESKLALAFRTKLTKYAYDLYFR
ncbi:unnamed protein product, partial [Didymodactylos carnosus]